MDLLGADETGFEVLRSTDTGATWTTVASLPAGSTEWNLAGASLTPPGRAAILATIEPRGGRMEVHTVPDDVVAAAEGDAERLLAALWHHDLPAGTPEAWERRIGRPLVMRPGPAAGPAPDAVVAVWSQPGFVRFAYLPGSASPPPTSASVSERYDRPCAVHTLLRSRSARWGWPLRVGVRAPEPEAYVVRARGWWSAPSLLTVVEPTVPVDVLLLDSASIPFDPGGLRAGLVVLLGTVSATDDQLDFLVRGLRAGAVALVDDTSREWFGPLVDQLAHDAPLDVAFAIACPDAALLASPEQLRLTSLRALLGAWQTTESLAGDQVEVPASLLRFRPELPPTLLLGDLARLLLDLAGRLAFDRETGMATTIADVSRALEQAGRDRIELEADLVEAMAPPPEAPDEATPGRGVAPVAPSAPPPRYLNVRPRQLDASGQERDDEVVAFVGGCTYRFAVAIRARRAAGARVLDDHGAPVAFPVSGRDVELTVVVFPRGRLDLLQKGSLHLPATGDSGWCALDVLVPAGPDRFELVVGVFGDGPLQVGVVSGRVVADDDAAAAAEPWTFDLASLGVLGVDDPAPAMVVDDTPPVGSEPVDTTAVLRLAPGSVTATAEGIGKAALRNALLDALRSERARPTLAHLAPTLAALAIDGRLLRDQLLGAGPSPFDGAERIRVVSTEAGDPLPLELVYDHAAPRDHTVPICPPALAGAKRCDATCDHRDDTGVVCPYGFWGTSRIVERVRVARPAAAAAAVAEAAGPLAVSRGALVGISAKVTTPGTTAAARIVRAVAAVVKGRRRVVQAATWEEWDRAVEPGPPLLTLVTHTDEIDGRPALEIGGVARPLHQIVPANVNPRGAHPGPLVLLLGCDTAHLAGSYTTVVDRLHCVGADVVVSVQTPVRGAHVATLLGVLTKALHEQLGAPQRRPFGAVLRDTRAELLRKGRVVGLALTTTGDAGIELE